MFAVAGTAHLLRPRPFDAIIPPALPHPRAWTIGSGIAELALASGLLTGDPRVRRASAYAAAGLLVGVFPGNLQMCWAAWHDPDAGRGYRALTVLRLPVQVPLVLAALAVAGEPAVPPVVSSVV
ncbi:putative membrane protein [Motilibacter rhizosphaerae]|uniref:Putative membrane protein n=1 Tax=Motilibacter rhizosphaerae TaxID=598652 RepID=A0A4Q7NC23_9ACTN|nr:hypothetical protein [Motilibacter rhizosphaerae]RZS80167.1 putative membrane protein [Motilibacter rhizosphaerae]